MLPKTRAEVPFAPFAQTACMHNGSVGASYKVITGSSACAVYHERVHSYDVPSMTKPTLDFLATARAKLEEELRKLDEQETQLRRQQTAEAFSDVMGLLAQYSALFSAKQKADIVAAVGSPRPKKVVASKEIAPKYWLPHSGDTWTGRGRPPRAFTAWEGTAAYKEWKAKHPNEKFPKFPG